jgi:hypothetical protein
MSGGDKVTRARLLDFLDRELFEPVMKAKGPSGRERRRFLDAKRALSEQRRRYRGHAGPGGGREYRQDHYISAEEVREVFLLDTVNRTTARLNDNLEYFGLPSFRTVKDGFLKLCETYQVGGRPIEELEEETIQPRHYT